MPRLAVNNKREYNAIDLFCGPQNIKSYLEGQMNKINLDDFI